MTTTQNTKRPCKQCERVAYLSAVNLCPDCTHEWVLAYSNKTRTKVEAIKLVMRDHGGQATLTQIYNETKKYKKDVDQSEDNWKAGLRGVLYREVRNNKTFKKVHEATYGLI